MSEIFFDIKSAHRTIYIDKNSKVTCIDEVTADNKKCHVRWNMVTPAEVKIINKRAIILKKDGKEVILRSTTPHTKAYILSNEPTTEYDCKNEGTCRVGFEMTVPAGKSATLKVELIPQK